MRKLTFLLCIALGFSFAQETNNEVDVVVKSMFMSDFCKKKTAFCPNDRPDHKRYNGMSGKLNPIPVGEEFGENIYKIKMKDNSILYFHNKSDDFFNDRGGLVTLSSHEKRLQDAGKPIIEGSSIIVDKVVLDTGGIGYKYHLSTGDELWGDKFTALKSLLREIPKEHEIALMEIIQDIDIKHDDVEDRFFLSIKEPMDTRMRERLPIQPYIGIQDGRSWMRFKVYYVADNWLFVEKVLIKTDDKKRTFDNLYFKRDNSGGTIWEWADINATDQEIQTIKDIISSENTTVRFYGKNYYNDRKISNKQKKLLENILQIQSFFQ